MFAVTKPKPHYNLLDRFLVMMERKEIPVILCFNKTDLAEHPEIAELEEVYASCGYPVLFTSAKKEENIEKIKSDAERKDDFHRRSVRCRKVLSDQSSPVRRTDGNRKYQQKNCKRKAYDTRHSELIMISPDSYIMDTPGFSSLYVNDFEKKN